MRTMSDHGLGARLSQALFGLAFYAWKTLLPFGLSPLYEMPENFNPLDWRFLLSGLTILCATLLLFVARRRWPAGLTCWVCYMIILSPVLGIAQSGPQMVADRYSYLSCLSWAALAGAALYRFYRSPLPSIVKFRPLASGAAITILTLLGIMTWHQSQIWQHSELLWRHVLAVTDKSYFRPSAAHNNLGVVLMNQERYEEAIRHYREALAINPRFTDAYSNLGHSFFRIGQWAESTKFYRQAIDINPGEAQSYYNLGNALVRDNQPDDAIRAYREASRLRPLDARPHYNIGTILAQRNELEAAIQSFRAAIRLDPNYAPAHANLGTALAIMGQFDDAIEHFRQSLRIEPGNSVAHDALARIVALRRNQGERARK